MQRVKIFEFDADSKKSEDAEKEINEYVNTLLQKDPKLNYTIISTTHLKLWRIIIYF